MVGGVITSSENARFVADATLANGLGQAKFATFRVAFVDVTIAVIIKTVALFHIGLGILNTDNRAVVALTETNCARSEEPVDCASKTRLRIHFIGLAIAIIIQTVAAFLLCLNIWLAYESAPSATKNARAADTRAFGEAVLTDPVIGLIG